MPTLVSAVVFLGAFCVLNLILLIGVLKRLREHAQQLASVNGPSSAVALGTEIGEFTVRTVDDRPLSRESLDGETLVGFFSSTCAPCKETMPKFVAHAERYPGGRDRVLAVVTGDPARVADFIAELRVVAQVVTNTDGDKLADAFQITAFPALLHVSPDAESRLVVTANQLALGEPSTVPA
ncbi:TlpA disulfide reductase family protein [Micromonospora sp. NPDC048170]|uniref:TlpA disulfide reductase family protein n=1 Tax=Micromonospora sp. NPDC048170 TaxID=3154819 RepID=UPI0033FEE997